MPSKVERVKSPPIEERSKESLAFVIEFDDEQEKQRKLRRAERLRSRLEAGWYYVENARFACQIFTKVHVEITATRNWTKRNFNSE